MFDFYLVVVLFCTDMNNKTVLERVQQGYRMPPPSGGHIECPPVLYDIMLQCWNADPESRPTFDFLRSLFDDYFVATQQQYRDLDAQ